MRTEAPPLLPLLRSQVQGRILARLYLFPADEVSVSELARELGVPVKTVHHEVTRLVDSGFLADRRVGSSRLLRAPGQGPIVRPLTDLLAVTYGPQPVLEEQLSGIPGVREAVIYGSWAARHSGVPGPLPNDVDVLVIGEVSLDDLDDVADRAYQRLGREVNIRRVSERAWQEGADPLVSSVQARPQVRLQVRETMAGGRG